MEIPAPPEIEPRSVKLVKFIIGLMALFVFYLFFVAGFTPPGVFGEVLRHNRENDIDASPMFYTEVENMYELEAGVKFLRDKIDTTIDQSITTD